LHGLHFLRAFFVSLRICASGRINATATDLREVPAPFLDLPERCPEQLLFMEGKGVGGIRDYMEFLGLAGGLEQLLGLAGQNLRIRGSLDEEDGTGNYGLNIANRIMPVKVAEKTGLEEELLGVVPACDGASLTARGEERFAAEDRGEDRCQVRGRCPADDPLDALVACRRGKGDCAAQAVADEIDRRSFQAGDGVRESDGAPQVLDLPVTVMSAKSPSLSPLPAKSKRSTANPCSRAQRANLTNSRLSLTLSPAVRKVNDP
jgi:hypothetical protein